jgi:general secretion pathway protein G
MIVVSIIGILASIAIPKFADMLRKSKEGTLKGNLGAIRSALAIYYADMEGWYPSNCAMGCASAAQYTSPSALPSLTTNNKYLASIPLPSVPDYHLPATSWVGGIEQDVVLAPGSSIAAFPYWEINGGGIWTYFSSPSNQASWGQVFVGCTHTDTKGTQWSSY